MTHTLPTYRHALRVIANTTIIAALAGAAGALSGCAAEEEPEAPALLSQGDSSPGREAYFDALWGGHYDRLDSIITVLTEETSQGDAKSQAVLGFAHAWKLAEYRRAPESPTITDHAKLATDAFHNAMQLFPNDARLQGFRGSFRQARGRIEENSLLSALGWFDEVASAQRWPSWGLFTKAYGLITFEPEESLYQQGIDALWENLDACAGVTVDREAFNLEDYPALGQPYLDPRLDRACNNTRIAPYNLDGFFLYFGDMYAKASDTENAASMYETALSLSPGSWPYAYIAQDRLDSLDQLPAILSQTWPSNEAVTAEEINMFQGPISCVGCHQGPDSAQ